MDSKEFKRTLFIKLLGDEDLQEQLDKAKETTIRTDKILSDEKGANLEGINDVTPNDITFDEALDRVCNELNDNRKVYDGWKEKLAEVIYNRMVAQEDLHISSEGLTVLHSLCDQIAKRFLNDLIAQR